MKKTIKRKLQLNAIVVRELTSPELSAVNGGLSKLTSACLSCNCVTPDCPNTK